MLNGWVVLPDGLLPVFFEKHREQEQQNKHDEDVGPRQVHAYLLAKWLVLSTPCPDCEFESFKNHGTAEDGVEK
jgi:hypothetical protein